MMLVGTLETLGTHFKIPLGTENLLTLQNLIVCPFSCSNYKFQLVVSKK